MTQVQSSQCMQERADSSELSSDLFCGPKQGPQVLQDPEADYLACSLSRPVILFTIVPVQSSYSMDPRYSHRKSFLSV